MSHTSAPASVSERAALVGELYFENPAISRERGRRSQITENYSALQAALLMASSAADAAWLHYLIETHIALQMADTFRHQPQLLDRWWARHCHRQAHAA